MMMMMMVMMMTMMKMMMTMLTMMMKMMMMMLANCVLLARVATCAGRPKCVCASYTACAM